MPKSPGECARKAQPAPISLIVSAYQSTRSWLGSANTKSFSDFHVPINAIK